MNQTSQNDKHREKLQRIYAKPKDPRHTTREDARAGNCACCGRVIELESGKGWLLAHAEGRGPFPAHTACWEQWSADNYPRTPTLGLMVTQARAANAVQGVQT
jgi:hypothetical protein